MMKKNKLYTVTRFNKPMFMGNRETQNIFDGFDLSKMARSYFDGSSAKRTFDMNLGTSMEQQYLDSKNFLGLSKKNNPFSKLNMQGVGAAVGNAALSAGAGLVGSLGSSLISGGLQSDAGAAVSNIGGTIGGAVGAVNPIAGAAISVGSQLLGGLTNRMFGSKLNQENINAVNSNINKITESGNAVGQAQTNDELMANAGNMDMGFDFSNSFIGSDGWFSSKARRKAEELRRKQEQARAFSKHALTTGAQNADANLDFDVMSNFAAFGGPIDTSMDGAIGYGFMADYLDTKKKNIEDKNQMTNMFMGTPSSFFDLGGDIQMTGADYTTGLAHIDAGGSHEENPYDGVQMGVDREGTPNLVEEGETIYNDYVFSDRILADETTKKMFHLPKKKDITFAEISKRLEKEISERPNDPISKAGFKAQMQTLEDQQERQKSAMEAERARAAFEALSPEEQAAVIAGRRFDEGGNTVHQTATRSDMDEEPEYTPGENAGTNYHKYWMSGRQQQMQENMNSSGYSGTAAEETEKQMNNISAHKERYSDPNNPDDAHMYNPIGFTTIMGQSRSTRDEEGNLQAGDIVYNDVYKIYGGVPSDVIVHERTHAMNLNPWNLSPQESKVDAILREKYGDDVHIAGKYYLRPAEVYAGLMQQRYQLKLSPDYQVTPEDIIKWRDNGMLNEYLRDKDDDMLLRLFNEVAYEPVESQDRANYAAQGGSIVKNNGLIDFDNSLFGLEEVVVTGKKRKKKPELPTINATKNEVIQGLNAMQQQKALQNIAEAIEAKRAEEEMKYYRGYTPIHYYAKGGELKKRIYSMLPNVYTDSDFKKWVDEVNSKQKNSEGKLNYERMLDLLNKGDYANLKNNSLFWDKATQGNTALAHAIKNGYDFGQYAPNTSAAYTLNIDDAGNWNQRSEEGWKNSKDAAYLEAKEKGLITDNMTEADLEKVLSQTDAYKNATQILQNDEEARRRYFAGVLASNAPEAAKTYARKFVDDNGQWLNDVKDRSYAATLEKVRSKQPGTYWKTPVELNRGSVAQNFVLNEDGTVEPIETDIPTDWTSAGSYAWNDPQNAYTYNYYRRPVAAAATVTTPGTAAEIETPIEDTTTKVEPKLRAEWPRYAGLFGPAVGLGLMGAGVGKPDYSRLDAAVDKAGNVHLAGYKPLGNYLTYRPMDIWYEQNRMDANARATDRAIVNNAAPVGTKMAGLLASGYNNQIADGELFRRALEYNDAKRAQVAEFNRGTDQYNADAYTRNSQFNAAALNDAEGRNLNAQLHAATERMNRDAQWYNSLYGNINGLFRGISDLGRENAQWNMIARGAADGVYGNLGDSWTGQKVTKRKAEGGKVRKKKGLTY